MQASVNEHSQLEIDAFRRPQPVKFLQHRCDVLIPRRSMYQSGGGIEHRLKAMELERRKPCECLHNLSGLTQLKDARAGFRTQSATGHSLQSVVYIVLHLGTETVMDCTVVSPIPTLVNISDIAVDCGRFYTWRKSRMWSQQQDHHTADITWYKILHITLFDIFG